MSIYFTSNTIVSYLINLSAKAVKDIPQAEHVKHIVLKFFGVIRQGAVAALGISDILVQGFYQRRKLRRAPIPYSYDVDQRIKNTFKYKVRGTLQFASGVIGINVAWELLHHEKLSETYHKLNILGNGLFIGANLISFYQNYSLFNKAQHTINHSPHQAHLLQAYNERRAAIIGMVSSFFYIVSAVMGLFETVEIWLALAIIFGCIAPATAIVQYLYEAYFKVGDFAPVELALAN
jgi:hypothetical protein